MESICCSTGTVYPTESNNGDESLQEQLDTLEESSFRVLTVYKNLLLERWQPIILTTVRVERVIPEEV